MDSTLDPKHTNRVRASRVKAVAARTKSATATIPSETTTTTAATYQLYRRPSPPLVVLRAPLATPLLDHQLQPPTAPRNTAVTDHGASPSVLAPVPVQQQTQIKVDRAVPVTHLGNPVPALTARASTRSPPIETNSARILLTLRGRQQLQQPRQQQQTQGIHPMFIPVGRVWVVLRGILIRAGWSAWTMSGVILDQTSVPWPWEVIVGSGEGV